MAKAKEPTYAELNAQREKIEAQMKSMKQQRIKELRQRISTMISEEGFTLAETVGVKRMKKLVEESKSKSDKGSDKKVKTEPKYRNPKDETQTWSGKGRPPAWMLDKNRKKKEEYLIKE
jgi:DNA-binding protein H-NS